MIFSGVTILQGVEFPIFPIDFAWALQQCSATALPVIHFNILLQYSNSPLWTSTRNGWLKENDTNLPLLQLQSNCYNYTCKGAQKYPQVASCKLLKCQNLVQFLLDYVQYNVAIYCHYYWSKTGSNMATTTIKKQTHVCTWLGELRRMYRVILWYNEDWPSTDVVVVLKALNSDPYNPNITKAVQLAETLLSSHIASCSS